MTETAPSQEESPTCRVRHFSIDPDDSKGLVGGAKIKTISRVALPRYQARGFAEVDADGALVGEIPKTEPEPAAKADAPAKTATASTGGKN